MEIARLIKSNLLKYQALAESSVKINSLPTERDSNLFIHKYISALK